jgi:glycogen debranching enzyme
VLALDGDKRPCRVRASNAGHALMTGLALPQRAGAVVRTLMSPESFSGYGVRTLASVEARFNPMSYHNGSVWPHDNALIAAGFARYGFRREAGHIYEGLFAASTYMDLLRLPELFCGFSRRMAMAPVFYPVACTPQAWATAAPLHLIATCLGLSFDPDAREIRLERPLLPAFLNELVIRRLTVAGGAADIAVRRVGADVVVHVLERSGDVRVAMVQ